MTINSYHEILISKTTKFLFTSYFFLLSTYFFVDIFIYPFITTENFVYIVSEEELLRDPKIFDEILQYSKKIPIDSDINNIINENDSTQFFYLNIREVVNQRTTQMNRFINDIRNAFPNRIFILEINSLYPPYLGNKFQELLFKYSYFKLWLIHVYFSIFYLFFTRPYYAVPLLVVIYLAWIKTRSVRRRLRRRFKTKRKILAAILLRRR